MWRTRAVSLFQWALPLLLVWAFLTWVGAPARISGSSMSPTLEEGEWVWLWKPTVLGARFPRRGEVVATLAPPNTPYSLERGAGGLERRTQYVKRVVGLPGDTLELRDGELYRDGVKTHEPYTSSDVAAFSVEALTLEPTQFYVLGDNRRLGESIDSRFFGPVSRADLLGRVGAVLWPPSRWRVVR